MKLKEYIKQSARTDKDLGDKNRIHWLLGAYNEFGEMIGVIKKDLFPNKTLDKKKLSDELGDVIWYLAKGFRVTRFTIPDTYAYEEQNNILSFIATFNQFWQKEDIMGMTCVVMDMCNFYEISIEDCLDTNIAKLKARHPNGFDINNEKHTKKEQDVIEK